MSLPALETLAFTPDQTETLLAAKAWWQEGERALDYLAERARLDTILAALRPHLDALRTARYPQGIHVAPLLPLLRRLSANRAINKALASDAFAVALRALLFGDDAIPIRLETFLATQKVGPQTASHFLYGAFPDRFALVADATRAVIAPANEQKQTARRQAMALYGEGEQDTTSEVAALLGDFALYEVARRLLELSSFTDLNAVLWHAHEMPTPKRRKSGAKGTVVRERGSGYKTKAAESSPNQIETSEADLLAFIEAQIASQGFTFPPLTVRNYYVALKTKPFVILTGLSGTGKTRLTRLFAEALTGDNPDQYLLVPVRPDWTDPSALLGYYNIVSDRYISMPFLDRLRLAARPEMRERAVFICLDEMNLARVEHYFADLLSAMETPDGMLPLSETQSVRLNSNVFLTGSVNIDEATHPFSRKVLDRANLIEFGEVNFAAASGDSLRPASVSIAPPPPERQRIFLTGRVSTIADATDRLRALSPDYPDRTLSVLSALNDLLSPRGLHFGYRVRDEVMRYVAASFTRDGTGLLVPVPDPNLHTALDLQIVQKILPRVSGTYEGLSRLLSDLETWMETRGFIRAQAKLARIRERAKEDGIVTFYEL